MATSKKSSTSKTARVMNLLSKSREDTPAEQNVAPTPAPAAVESAEVSAQNVPVAEPAAPAAPAPAAHSNHTTPLISSMQADSAISNQVLSALENALDEELSTAQDEVPAAPAPSAAPVQEAVVENAAPAEEETAEPAPVPEALAEEPEEVAPVPEVVSEPVAETAPVSVQEPAPAPVAAAAPSAESAEDPAPPTQFKVDADTTYVNVMETLVEEKANKYIDLFGLCKCHRCVADVKAYALNHLNPKYVVMRTGEVIPRITLYENQFSAVVTAQILNACKIVMASPRHDSN